MAFYPDEKDRPMSPQAKFLLGGFVVLVGALIAYSVALFLVG